MNTATITGRIKAGAAMVDPNRYGRSDRSAMGRWFWEIDRVLLLLLAVLIGFGLIAVAAASALVALLSLMNSAPSFSRTRSNR